MADGRSADHGDGPGTPLVDVGVDRTLLGTEVLHQGMVFDLVRDTVDLGSAGTVRREYLRHPGAVAVVALDETDRVLLLRQYRHPVRRELWEVPAGLRDLAGEDLRAAAERELAEEADVTAASWWVLTDFFTSPGASSEAIRVFLARDLAEVPTAERHERTEEERDMVATWVPLDDAVSAALAGRIGNPSAVVGVLAAEAARARGWVDLRPA